MTCDAISKRYNPFISDGNGDITPPSSTEPSLTQVNQVRLTWPYSSPTLTIDLRSPELGNEFQTHQNRISRKSRGGSLIIYKDSIWPEFKVLTMSFDNKCGQDFSTVLDFLKQSLGQEIGLLDYESRQWKGIIRNPDTAIGREGPNDFNFNLEFEGELV